MADEFSEEEVLEIIDSEEAVEPEEPANEIKVDYIPETSRPRRRKYGGKNYERKLYRRKIFENYQRTLSRGEFGKLSYAIYEENKLRDALQKDGFGKLSRRSIAFYDTVMSILKYVQLGISRPSQNTPLVERQHNMDLLAQELESSRESRWDPKEKKRRKNLTLAERLKTFGENYVERFELGAVSDLELYQFALKYDLKGIIPISREGLDDFVYRANSTLFMHNMLRENKQKVVINFDEKKFDIDLAFEYGAKIIDKTDIEEANQRIPYHMDLSWMTGFVDAKSPILSFAYGVCFTSPKHNGFNFLVMRNQYKSREEYLRVLSHEMTHMGTVYFDDSPELLETKAYTVGTAAFGEYTIALNQRPHLLQSLLKWGLDRLTFGAIPNPVYKFIPKIYSAITIAERKSRFEGARRRLQEVYGEQKGDYIVGRLGSEEVNEFFYTNDIHSRFDSKDGLKWNIIRDNLGNI